MKKPIVCIAPLDWGLGHATRCIALAKALQQLDYQIVFASEGHHMALLKEAMPDANFLPLAGYRIRYTKKGKWFLMAMLLQLPKIIFSIYYERRWIRKTQKQFQFDLIISDNRFGFCLKNIPSVFITHQLNIQTPWKGLSALIQKWQYQFIQNFSACWIPDTEAPSNLAGALSHPIHFPKIPIWYMGALSRLTPNYKSPNPFPAIKFLGIVSGPEPQRTLFENALWAMGNGLQEPFAIIAGKPLQMGENIFTRFGTLYPHANGEKLAQLIQSAEIIVCRGGYTSLMELLPFQKKLVLVPTPGQTEQMYLAKWWSANHWAQDYAQENFDLNKALNIATNTDYEQAICPSFSVETLELQLKEVNL